MFCLYDDVIVGVDIGSTKVSTVIAKANRNGQMEFMGSGLVPCTGIKKGLIVDEPVENEEDKSTTVEIKEPTIEKLSEEEMDKLL